jgi:hypothetical protein
MLESTAFEFARTAVKLCNISIPRLMLSRAKNAGMTLSLRALLTTDSCPSEAVLGLLIDHYGIRKVHSAVSNRWGGILAVPLYFAVGDGNVAVIRLPLEHGAETEHRRGVAMITPLIKVQINNRADAMKALLEGGADPRRLHLYIGSGIVLDGI